MNQKVFMKNRKLLALLAIPALGLSFLTVGCDRTVAHNESTTVKSDGSVKQKETPVTEHSDGSISKTETRKSSTPDKP